MTEGGRERGREGRDGRRERGREGLEGVISHTYLLLAPLKQI